MISVLATPPTGLGLPVQGAACFPLGGSTVLSLSCSFCSAHTGRRGGVHQQVRFGSPDILHATEARHAAAVAGAHTQGPHHSRHHCYSRPRRRRGLSQERAAAALTQGWLHRDAYYYGGADGGGASPRSTQWRYSCRYHTAAKHAATAAPTAAGRHRGAHSGGTHPGPTPGRCCGSWRK